MTAVRIQSNKIVLHGVKGNYMLLELWYRKTKWTFGQFSIIACALDRWKAWQLGYHQLANPSWPAYMALISCGWNSLSLSCLLLKEVRSVYSLGTKRFGLMPIWIVSCLPLVNTRCPGIIPAHSLNLKVPLLVCIPVARESFSKAQTNNFLIRVSLA